MEKYKKGEIKVLCNADILIAGFDEPKASVCLNLRPTLSPVIAEQRGGRVLRLDEENEDKHATIVDFVDINNNKKVQPITFAEIAGASIVYPSSKFRDSKSRVEGGGQTAQSPEIEIEGLRVITNSEEVMKVVNRMIEEKAELAPDGWITCGGLSNELKIEYKVIKKIDKKYRISNPEWFKRYLDSRGRLFEHYSPELVEEIKKVIDSRERAPEGWITETSLYGSNLGIGRKTLINLVDKYKNTNPEWAGEYLSKRGRLLEHYSPELVEKIKEELVNREMPPDGWFSIVEISSELGKKHSTIKNFADKFKEEHPDWFKKYFVRGGLVAEHYSPELVEKIREQYKSK